MDKKEIGPVIKRAFNFLAGIFSDTSKLLTIVEEKMKKDKYYPLWGSVSVWDRSWAYYGYYGWLPNYICRFYVPMPFPKEKPKILKGLGAFINIYFVPQELEQPIIVFGAVKIRQEDFWKSWVTHMLQNEGPTFVQSDNSEEWISKTLDGNDPIDTIYYRVRPLTEVNAQPLAITICDDVIKKVKELGG